MKKKDALDDLELHIDPTPLTKEEEIELSKFIRQLKEKAARKKNRKKSKLKLAA